MATKPRSAHLHPGPGFRVKMNITRPPRAMMDRLREFPTPDVSDLLNRLYVVDPEIRCLTSDRHQLCGPALTVKVYPGDNLMVHKALDIAECGDVVIVDASGSHMNAVLGDLICTKAKHRGIAGFIIDGLMRDLPGVQALDMPVFARGTTPIGPLHRGPGEINFAICCGGVVVNPGDVVLADAMGVVVVPAGIADELVERLEQHNATNAVYLEAVKQGTFSNEWVDRILAASAIRSDLYAARVQLADTTTDRATYDSFIACSAMSARQTAHNCKSIPIHLLGYAAARSSQTSTRRGS